MRFRILGVLASLALVAACETPTTETGAATGAGGGTGATTTQGTSAPAPQPMESMSLGDQIEKIGNRVFFDFDKYNLKPEARAQLEKQARWLKINQGVTVNIEGHCDERGTREYNLALGERRANAAKDYLVFLGIDPARLRTISYGKERPEAVGSNEAVWAQNRRAVTKPTGVGS
jgi:peptidoglycan-associated lipoprotein